jgi:hypothetical protein
MTYNYEQLDPERFQHLCQALLAKEFPNVQCFPVAQPDGGRDATVVFPREGRFNVFQVKFVRNPFKEFDRRKWLDDIISGELPKLQALTPKGAINFYLLTNVPGTAHPDSGTIDSLGKMLSDALDIPAVAWWRDDLDRRFDNAWSLKWIYPETMTGNDLLRMLIESGLQENKERRASTIRAYVKDQYERDKEVRFKQVELQNMLLDLFVDVPVEPRAAFGNRKEAGRFNRVWSVVEAQIGIPNAADFDPTPERRPSEIRAASLFLHSLGQHFFKRVVLEGAPGQGKSTISQYICQIHRMRLLELDELSNIPKEHANCPIRLPLKIDLRDLATWLSKKDPFSSEDKPVAPSNWAKTLESFLAAQVRYHSGGTDFTVEDLFAISARSALLLVFDGLDEVADISRRTEVVDEIDKGVNRLSENALSLQVIVTSRPAAFANSPGLPEDKFNYFHLESISRPLIDRYTERWLKARKLYGRESSEVRKILKEKLDQPHLRDLARNPMQLAILLSLIHRRGASLPDKRTALYDSYIDLFFGREAEKSSVVREHRDLLIDLHRYLAWILHTEAERGHDRASISIERLQSLLHGYLKSECHDPGLVDRLFHGMVERVVALVSRVEGTFEFEVQPLREYFAARYLYETAPYSPPGDEKRGTKPDRFDAISRNFYWLNVTRFYAGCFSKGELPALVDRLQELARDKQFRRLSHPRILAGILLSDWVFAQHPRSVREVVGLVLDGLGVRYIVNSVRRRISSGTPLVLPKRSGNEELVDRCFDLLRLGVPRDFGVELADVLKANATSEELTERWLPQTNDKGTGAMRTQWLEYGLWLGVLSQLSHVMLEEVVADAPLDIERLSLLLKARQVDFLQNSVDRSNAIVEALLNGDVPVTFHGRSLLEAFSNALSPHRYAIAMNRRSAASLDAVWKSRSGSAELLYDEPKPGNAEIIRVVDSFLQKIKTMTSASIDEWSTSLTGWDRLVETGRETFGDKWRFSCLAAVGAGIKSQQEKAAKHGDLFDHRLSLCKRARYARLRASQAIWWQRHFASATTVEQRMLVCLLGFTWCIPEVLLELLPSIDHTLNGLGEAEWNRFVRGLGSCVGRAQEGFDFSKSLPEKLPARVAVCYGFRGSELSREGIFKKHLQQYAGTNREILGFGLGLALDFARANSPSWNPQIRFVSHAYRAGLISEPYIQNYIGRYGTVYLKLKTAEQIADNADKYPGYLVAVAESRLRNITAKAVTPVAQTAELDQWFAD